MRKGRGDEDAAKHGRENNCRQVGGTGSDAFTRRNDARGRHRRCLSAGTFNMQASRTEAGILGLGTFEAAYRLQNDRLGSL